MSGFESKSKKKSCCTRVANRDARRGKLFYRDENTLLLASIQDQGCPEKPLHTGAAVAEVSSPEVTVAEVAPEAGAPVGGHAAEEGPLPIYGFEWRRDGKVLLRYLLDSEVHTFAFSVAANAILSFIPFIVLLYTVAHGVLHSQAMVAGDWRHGEVFSAFEPGLCGADIWPGWPRARGYSGFRC